MKIIVVGASGLIGSQVVEQLSPRHEVVRVARTSGDVLADYTQEQAVREMFRTVGPFDALVATVGEDGIFKPYEDVGDDDYLHGFERKFLGQVRLVRIGEHTIRDGGSFTLSSGYLSHHPKPHTVAIGPLAAAVNGFVSHTAPLLKRGVRINAVSPCSINLPGEDRPGAISAAESAAKYVEAVEGTMTGRILYTWGDLPHPE